MSDTSDDKGKDSQAEQISKPENPQSTDNSKKSTDSETQPSSQALEEKQKGNEAYKKKDFTTAHRHYDKAIELDPTEIIFRNNKAAVYFEQKDYDKCIEVSEEAITIGRENRADYTLIAKALARAGKAFLKKEDDDNALRYLNKSLSEHRTTETQKLCYGVHKRMKEKERLAYLDPEKALEAKTLGNEHFKKGDYPTAKKHDEAIKRHPEDDELFSIILARSTMDINQALKDDKCIELCPMSRFRFTEQQVFHEKVPCEEETSDQQQRSILLVDIMNAIGFSKTQREINIHRIHLWNVLLKIVLPNHKTTDVTTGSISEGLCGGMYNKIHHDYDQLLTIRHVKLYTPRTNHITNNPLSSPHDNEDYYASFFVEGDEKFPGYVKLALHELKNNYLKLGHATRMNGDTCYLSSSMMMLMNYLHINLSEKNIEHYAHPFFGSCQKFDMNGPAYSFHHNKHETLTKTTDDVFCLHYDMWPTSANSFITRRKPNNWPSNRMLENIKSQGCDVVSVGHHDSQNNDIQWRISFPGEHNLLLDLTDVQILCYVLIKIILQENLNTSQREVVSSFHIKHVMLWCVELCSCHWVDSNYINCLNICLAKLIEMIKARYIPHYIIESRNLFNSKMTKKMSTEIVDVLSKCDTTRIFRLDAFENVKTLKRFYSVKLKHKTLISTIMACFDSCFGSFLCSVKRPLFWSAYVPHSARHSLLIYRNILEHLKKEEGVTIHYVKYLVWSMVGFLDSAEYKDSKELIQKSLDLDNSCVQLRAATFFLTHQEYSQSIEICDRFLTFLTKQRLNGGYVRIIWRQVLVQLEKVNTTEEIENIMKAILPMLYSSVELKSLPGNYDITQNKPVWIFRNITNIFFHGLCIDATFMTAEKWVVPDPILYELLSLPQPAADEMYPFFGIDLDPMFVCLQTKFLCYHSMGNVNVMAKILTSMNSLITENTFTTKSSCVYLNMFTYCQIKAGHHRQSVKSILQSLRMFPPRYNTASGYLKIVLQILNSLSL